MATRTRKKSRRAVSSPVTTSKTCSGALDPLENRIREYLKDFAKHNHAAQVVQAGLCILGIGLRPLVDHITFRTLDIDRRAREFIKFGYVWDGKLGVIQRKSWLGKLFRKPGYPCIFIDQPLNLRSGKGKEIADWVRRFGDKKPHHIAIQVDDLFRAVYYLEKQGVPFDGVGSGDTTSDYRRVFSQPSVLKGHPYTSIELTERHRGYSGFALPHEETEA